MLQDRASGSRNWMEEWWEQLAYLRTRTTMAININWFGVLPDWGFPIDKVSASAALLDGMLQTRARIEEQSYPLETMRGNPLDMHQFSRVFGMTRVPAEGAASPGDGGQAREPHRAPAHAARRRQPPCRPRTSPSAASARRLALTLTSLLFRRSEAAPSAAACARAEQGGGGARATNLHAPHLTATAPPGPRSP